MWKNNDIDYFKQNAYKKLAKSETEALQKYDIYGSKDPFPEIPSSLLNSADIFKYVQKTAMLLPFYPELLKGATYPVKIGDSCTYWDEKGIQHVALLTNGESFELIPNSIAFVELEPMFRVPDYIALRFNLTIKHIYKGLLLGTGPIVDPGFKGKLYIPLHNLTNNSYFFKGGEELIYMEFTKISPNKRWFMKTEKGVDGVYVPFPEKKLDRPIAKYIQDALLGYTSSNEVVVKNSIPSMISSFEAKVEESNSTSKKAIKSVRKIYTFGFIGLLVLVIAFVQLFVSVDDLIQSLYAQLDEYKIVQSKITVDIDSIEKETITIDDIFSETRYTDLSGKIKILENENEELHNTLNDIKDILDDMKGEYNEKTD